MCRCPVISVYRHVFIIGATKHVQSAVPKSEYCVHSDWYGPRGEVRTASKHVMGVNRPAPQTIQSGTDTCELENLPALIG